MIGCNPNGDHPEIHPSSYIDPSAVVIGAVTIGKKVYVGPGAVVRADEARSSISIGDGCNVQDRVIVHALTATRVVIKNNTSLAHGCIVHGPCIIGENCFIGFGSVVFGAILGNGVFIRHLAVIEEARIPEGSVIPSRAVKGRRVKKANSRAIAAFAKKVVDVNVELADGYNALGRRDTGDQRVLFGREIKDTI